MIIHFVLNVLMDSYFSTTKTIGQGRSLNKMCGDKICLRVRGGIERHTYLIIIPKKPRVPTLTLTFFICTSKSFILQVENFRVVTDRFKLIDILEQENEIFKGPVNQ